MDLNRLFNSQTKTVTSAAGILAVSGILSGCLSVVGDFLLAKRFGAGPLDVYFAAFRLPDLVYNILIAGGIVVAFLPLFSEYFSKSEKEAWNFSSNCLNIFLVLLIFLCLLLSIFTPSLVKLIAPGFNSEQVRETIFLTRLMFISPILFGLSNIFSGILQYFNRFFIYGLCPIFYNLGIIFGILFLAPKFGILGVVLGVIFGAFLHLAIQIPSAINSGFSYQPIVNFKDPSIKRFFLLVLPTNFGILAQQINLVIITAIASTLSLGSIAIFTFANNLQNFIIGIIGTSFAISAFSTLSKAWVNFQKEREKKIPEEFIENFSLIFRFILYFIIPFSVLIFVLRNQIITVWLRHGQFSLIDAKLTAASLGVFCLGLFASSLLPLIFRAFFAIQNTKTPTLIGIISVSLNVILSLFLKKILNPATKLWLGIKLQEFIKNILFLEGIKNISVLSLALAVSMSTIFQFIFLLFFLKRRIGDFKLKEIFNSFLKILIASILMGIGVYFTLYLISGVLNTQTFSGVLWQTVIASLVGVLVYLLGTFLLRSPEIETIKSSILKI